jgi:hypothetical protein
MNDNRHQDGIYPFPAGMQSREIETNGAKIHVRVGGHGPAVVMLHGFGRTGVMWGHLASALIEDRMVVAPDLRGLGLSSKPDGGYDNKNEAADAARRRSLGSDHTGSGHVALWLRWSGHGAPSRRPRGLGSLTRLHAVPALAVRRWREQL